MQAIREAEERGEDELQRRMILFMSPSAARAQDPSFIQVHLTNCFIMWSCAWSLLPASCLHVHP